MVSPFTKILVKGKTSLEHLQQMPATGRFQGPTLKGLVENPCIEEHPLKDLDVGNVPITNWLIKCSRVREHKLEGCHQACVPITNPTLAGIVKGVTVPEHTSHIGNGGSIPSGKVLIKGVTLEEHVHNASGRAGNSKHG